MPAPRIPCSLRDLGCSNVNFVTQLSSEDWTGLDSPVSAKFVKDVKKDKKETVSHDDECGIFSFFFLAGSAGGGGGCRIEPAYFDDKVSLEMTEQK